MAVSGADDAGGRRRASELAQLCFLDGDSARLRRALATATVVASIVAGIGISAAQRYLAGQAADGATLNPVARLLASGSTALTVWPGWVAAAFFLIALWRLRHGPAEPPTGRGEAGQMSVADLRAGLRSEYTSVRVALLMVAVLAVVDTVRMVATIVTASSAGISGGTVVATVLEAAGLLCATAVLGLWAWSFRDHLVRWGAV